MRHKITASPAAPRAAPPAPVQPHWVSQPWPDPNWPMPYAETPVLMVRPTRRRRFMAWLARLPMPALVALVLASLILGPLVLWVALVLFVAAAPFLIVAAVGIIGMMAVCQPVFGNRRPGFRLRGPMSM